MILNSVIKTSTAVVVIFIGLSFGMQLVADQLESQPYTQYTQYAQYAQQYSQQESNQPQLTDRATNIILDHGITGVILLVLGWWYYKRQQQWDEEAAAMRKELLDYVKADQQSDYEMMSKIDNNKNELKNEVHELSQKIHELKEEIMYRTFDRRKVARE